MFSRQEGQGIDNEGFSVPAHDTLTEIPLGPPVDSKLQQTEQPQQHASRTGAEKEQEDYGPGCGWHFCFSGRCVRHSRTAKWLLFWMCCAAAVQGMVVNGFVNVSITTIEKRFNLKSRSTGIIASSYDVASLLVVVPVSYLGSRPGASKPRWLGLGLILMGLGSFTFLLPHFAVPAYEGQLSSNINGSDLRHGCHNPDFVGSDCDSSGDGSWLSNFLYVFILGQVLHGLGATPIYTLGMVFIDESVPLIQSSFYLGIFSAMAVVGPAVGYGLGGQFLKYYIDSPAINPALLGLTPSSDRWLGGWWMGFFLSGSLSLLVAFPILLIPAVIPRKDVPAVERQVSTDSTDALDAVGAAGASAFKHLDGFCTSSKKLLTNVTFIFLSLAEATEGFLVSGMATFMPKLLERQFGMQASLAAMIVGAVAVSAGGGGTFLGGWVIKKFRMACTSVIRLCFVVSSVGTVTCFFFFVYCPDSSFAGVSTPYTSLSPLSLPNITSSCNADCSCSDVPFSPVCGANNVIYFSPCHAGCTQSTKNNDQEIFSKCACVESLPAPENSTPSGRDELSADQATPNTCLNDCGFLPLFVLAMLIVMFITFFISMPNINGTLRCVESDNRGLALGLQAISFRLLGSIPGPLLFGVAIDQACTLWGDTCGVQGACVAYDNATLSRYMFAICFTAKFISTASFFVAWRKYASVETLKVELSGNVASISTSADGWPKTDRSKQIEQGYDNPASDVT
ncbi:Organic anion transporter polypeptide OATP [Trinorchestia longiramus]|nr:Organic anion transporter polypeptide OATP [Trinorchestia longiramus]